MYQTRMQDDELYHQRFSGFTGSDHYQSSSIPIPYGSNPSIINTSPITYASSSRVGSSSYSGLQQMLANVNPIKYFDQHDKNPYLSESTADLETTRLKRSSEYVGVDGSVRGLLGRM